MAEQQLQDRADALLHTLDLARSEAVKRGNRVDVCPDAAAAAPAAPCRGKAAGSSCPTPTGGRTSAIAIARERAAAVGHHDPRQPPGRRLRLVHEPRSRATHRRRAADGHVHHLPSGPRGAQGHPRQQRARAHRADRRTSAHDAVRRRGFTLLEMMIVVAIVAMLAAIALPSYAGYVKRSRILEAVTRLSDAACADGGLLPRPAHVCRRRAANAACAAGRGRRRCVRASRARQRPRRSRTRRRACRRKAWTAFVYTIDQTGHEGDAFRAARLVAHGRLLDDPHDGVAVTAIVARRCIVRYRDDERASAARSSSKRWSRSSCFRSACSAGSVRCRRTRCAQAATRSGAAKRRELAAAALVAHVGRRPR